MKFKKKVKISISRVSKTWILNESVYFLATGITYITVFNIQYITYFLLNLLQQRVSITDQL